MKVSFNNIYFRPLLNNDTNVKRSTNLLPLQKDTVSFGARAKLVGADMINAPNNKTCILAHNNAEPARYYLEKVLDKYLAPLTQTNNSLSNKLPIFEYNTRIKSPTSIREKVVSKYAKISSEDEKAFAQQAADLLLQNFKPNKGHSPRSVNEIVLNTVKRNQDENKIPPFMNVLYYFSAIIDTIEDKNVLDFSNTSQKEKKMILSKIMNELENNPPEREENHYDKSTGYINPTHIDGVKHYANDIVGARIIMRESDKEYANIVLKALAMASNDGLLKITSIQNNIPDSQRLKNGKNISDYEYASEQFLDKLAKKTGAKYHKIETKTGYMGIHINVDLSNEILSNYNGVYDGYSGEIQIIGTDVLELKKVEDLCYKIKDNKNAINSGYIPFRDHFLKYYSNPKTKKAFDDYTYDLYLAQRSLPPSITKKSTFPTIEELGYGGKIPHELDFNELAKIRESCKKKIDLIETQKRMEKDKKSNSESKKDSICKIFRDGNIATLKDAINYELK